MSWLWKGASLLLAKGDPFHSSCMFGCFMKCCEFVTSKSDFLLGDYVVVSDCCFLFLFLLVPFMLMGLGFAPLYCFLYQLWCFVGAKNLKSLGQT
jgi:hypothetical protein